MKTSTIRKFLDHKPFQGLVEYQIIETEKFEQFKRLLLRYQGSEKDQIMAYLFVPRKKIRGKILIHHQHAGQRHLGKSEVAGIKGHKYQFFAPALAKRGFLCLAPDSLCFEDRRINKLGTEPDSEENDWLQHYNQMAYRLISGTTLMKKVLDDASIALSLLIQYRVPHHQKVGILGHSYGGNTVIFQRAVDKRITHSCTSGAVCSFSTKVKHQIGIEMAEVIPGILEKFDVVDLLKAAPASKLLMVGADRDPFTKDIKQIHKRLVKFYVSNQAAKNLSLHFYKGAHPLTRKRFQRIVGWFDREM